MPVVYTQGMHPMPQAEQAPDSPLIASAREADILRVYCEAQWPAVETVISLPMKVPARWHSAAAFLKLTLSEYTRRRVLMDRLVLACMDPFTDQFASLYEPVALQFSPSKEI